jgi:hypothetical protein
MLMRSAALALAALSVGLASPAQAATPLEIPASTLVAQPQDFAGFGPARLADAYSTAYALEWALSYEQSAAVGEHEATELNALGFREGVAVYYSGRKEGRHEFRNAVSSSIAFATTAGPEHELSVTLAFDRTQLGRGGGPYRTAVRTIPGSVGLGHRGRKVSDYSLAFATGRCFFVVGDAIHKHGMARRAQRSATSAAIAVYSRAKETCA